MMVTFIAQCEKKALNKTRRVLDTFANRIGDRTWQTVITNEGLQAIKKLLRQTASKNTSVSCHWMRSRSRTELVWIVGNRRKFNAQGIVPVNTTQKTIMNSQWENDWHYLPLIKALTALAALFHDWGKASEFFQTKLEENKFVGDPLRHEWISTLFLNAFVNGETDAQWLTRLANGEITSNDLTLIVSERETSKPLAELPDAASFLAWLVISHHRLPTIDQFQGDKLNDFKTLFTVITQKWGYENKFDDIEYSENLRRCFNFPKGAPSDSPKWMKYAKRNARQLLDCLPLLDKSIENGSWRLVLHHARLALMLGDHYYSSLDADSKNRLNIHDLNIYANTDRSTKGLKQTLDEHLVGVAKQAVRNAHLLPAFEGRHDELQRAFDTTALKRKSPNKFRWQDTAVNKIIKWRENRAKLNPMHFGFFTVNMASTGKGKTFANAKIMRALSVDKESLRYVLALGLRTLTLQTGDEYRERIKLARDELAVLIGSRAVMELHDRNKTKRAIGEETETGSESQETLLDNEVYFEHKLPEGDFKTVLTSEKSRQFLFAPVLSCTIDHLMSATETKRGGRYILPSLRLMSSDLVIDEIDDFTGEDLIAIGRLIHLAAMLGRKVMISSATIPPDLAEGYYNAYQSGWEIFTKMRDCSPEIGCAWVDEFTTQVCSINCETADEGITDYQLQHQKFVTRRVKELQKQTPKRKANIVPCELLPKKGQELIRETAYATIQTTIVEKHNKNHIIEAKSGRRISFGVVRVANINPCVELTRFLLNADWPKNIEIRAMAYHSQQVLLMRSEQEKHLDEVLKRNKGAQAVFDNNTVIMNHLNSMHAKDIIFILVATPVEEVGRDHDFDWAVMEPSSYRSFIQLGGRVLRHRERQEGIESGNIAILQYNLKGLLGKDQPVFCYPGYETTENRLETHDLELLVDTQLLSERLDAQPRISKAKTLNPENNLVDLEHVSIHQLLTDYERQGPESMQGWLKGCWWLTAIPQHYVKFRRSSPQLTLFLVPVEGEWEFSEKDAYGKPIPREKQYGIKKDEKLSGAERQRLWLHRDYESLLEELTESNMEKAALIYGEITLPVYGTDLNDLCFTYSSQFGLVRK